MTDEQTLTPGQVVKRWGTSDSAVRRAIRADKLEGATKDEGGTWRIPLAAVVAVFGPEPVTPPKVAQQVEAQAEDLGAAQAQLDALEADLAASQARIADLEALVAQQAATIAAQAKVEEMATAQAERLERLVDSLTPMVNGLAGYLMAQGNTPQAIPATTSRPRRWWPWSRKDEAAEGT